MLNPHTSFASFVVGSSNRLAATAARTVAEAPGATYNPLFIYARPGLGKTHLLNAIGHAAIEMDGSRTVEYVTVDDFIEAYHAALGAGQADAYRRRFTEADLVLLDDAQLLADRRELQQELLRLIDVLTAADRQIVLAGDRPPEEIQQLDERLIRRFAGGLVIDISAPDYETRLAILARRADDRQATFLKSVLHEVAASPITTVRELLGALNRLIAQQAVQAEPITEAQAVKILEALGHRGAVGASGGGRGRDEGPVVNGEATATDEFTDFLSDLTSSLANRVDRWRQRVTEAALRWAGEGFRTGRLDGLLTGEVIEDPETALAAFEADVEALRSLQRELEEVAPELVSDSLLHDPDRVAEAEALVAETRETGAPLPGPSPRYTLESFAEGHGVRPALAAIRSAAEAAGQRYNPVVLVGHSSSGKTHLLHGFGHALRAGGLQRVAVLEGQQFVDELVAALRDGTVSRWRQRLRKVDALLIDDIAALAGKERSQEELYLLYNLLLESGRQMAFTSPVPPSQLSGFEERLLTRLSGGLVIELGLPDREAKFAEVQRLLGPGGADAELVDYLSSRPATSLRAVQQLVQRVAAAAEERGVTLSLHSAREILEGQGTGMPRAARRGSGLLAPGGGALRSREKMIESWPLMAERVIEGWR
jgi:chromosomal replication initiator protein